MPVALYQRAARQGHYPALLDVGDAFWYGRGMAPDWSRAGEVYSRAPLGQAFFNRGYMHQHGAGVPQDFHLAKRYYDKAASMQPTAWFPVKCALAALAVHSLLESIAPGRLLPAALLKQLLFPPLQQPGVNTAGQVAGSVRLRGGSAVVRGLLRFLQILSIPAAAAGAAMGRAMEAVTGSEAGESMLVAALVVVLLLVLRRRRALRALYGPPPGPLERQLSQPLPENANQDEAQASTAIGLPAAEDVDNGSGNSGGSSSGEVGTASHGAVSGGSRHDAAALSHVPATAAMLQQRVDSSPPASVPSNTTAVAATDRRLSSGQQASAGRERDSGSSVHRSSTDEHPALMTPE